jgi:hypothetical protein
MASIEPRIGVLRPEQQLASGPNTRAIRRVRYSLVNLATTRNSLPWHDAI